MVEIEASAVAAVEVVAAEVEQSIGELTSIRELSVVTLTTAGAVLSECSGLGRWVVAENMRVSVEAKD